MPNFICPQNSFVFNGFRSARAIFRLQTGIFIESRGSRDRFTPLCGIAP